MTTKEIIILLTIHFLVPLIGLLYFIYLAYKMKYEKIEDLLIFELFVVFVTYGGLLIVTLTTFLWFWSGMASLGTFYLLLFAPILMGFIAYHNKKEKDNSRYHLLLYKSGILYFIIAPLIFIVLLVFGK